MKTEKDKEIDDLFKRGLEASDARQGHMEEDWSAMEQMLDERKKRPVIVYWLPILGSAAALLLLVIGWWLLNPVVTPPHQKSQIALNKIDTVTPGTNKTKQTIEGTNTHEQQLANNNDTITPPKEVAGANSRSRNHNTTFANNIDIVKQGHKTRNDVAKINDVPIRPNNSAPLELIGDGKQPDGNLVAYNPGSGINEQRSINENIGEDNFLSHDVSNKSVQISKKKIGFANRPQFALTVLAASDKNSVGSFQSKAGNNAGLLLSVSLGKRFVISTGAVYDAKQYAASFANYHTNYQFPTNPVSVLANCKMFDIPLNIDYRVFNTYRNKISVGTGVSSYLMLHESYQYNYAEYASGPARYNVPNPDKYLFSIINFQATYERQINSNVGITLQPYMKLPLSAVGASQVRLQTTGVAVGLTWNLKSSSKP